MLRHLTEDEGDDPKAHALLHVWEHSSILTDVPVILFQIRAHHAPEKTVSCILYSGIVTVGIRVLLMGEW